MTVGELRKALEGVSDDMPLAIYDDKSLTEPGSASVAMCVLLTPEEILRFAPHGTEGKPYFVIS